MPHPHTSPARRRTVRLGASATIALCVAALVTGCAGNGPSGRGALGGVVQPSTSTSGAPTTTSVAPATTGPSTPVVHPTTHAPVTPSYPSDYAGAVLAAWSSHDWTRLALLTSDHPAIRNIAGHPDHHWTEIDCQGAMGSEYCSYYNNGGDEIIIRLTNAEIAAHHWHAASLNLWDAMSYPTDANAYTDKFLKGWIAGNKARMKLLSTSSVTSHFLSMSPPDPGYTLTPDGAAGHTYMHITGSGGFDATIALVNETVSAGNAHAIGDCFPTCS